jgi:hypothetical protein
VFQKSLRTVLVKSLRLALLIPNVGSPHLTIFELNEISVRF